MTDPILWGLGILTLSSWGMFRLFRAVDKSFEPKQLWALHDSLKDAPVPYGEPVEILYRRGQWVKFQGTLSGNVWCLSYQAFIHQYRHTGRSRYEEQI